MTDPHETAAHAAPAAIDDPCGIRRAEPPVLAQALGDARARTAQLHAACARALRGPDLAVPYRAEINPPLWELGHIAWFQEYWIARNAHCERGIHADPSATRGPSLMADADRLYDSSRVEHRSRWQLRLPDAAETLTYLDRSLARTLQALRGWDAGSDPLHGPAYFAWLALVHEDMHGEAGAYMANSLGIALDAPRPQAAVRARRGAGNAQDLGIAVAAGRSTMGSGGTACAFDNEMPAHAVDLPAFEIDAAPVSNGAFARFVEAGGYEDAQYWPAPAWAWLQQRQRRWPRFWRRAGSHWQQQWFGHWEDVMADAPVSNISAFEAEAWCRWAGRRLPSEAQWESAALARGPQAGNGNDFSWGAVWEWTADAFAPYPGFTAHPYTDYSRPWFGSRRVLRGASFATCLRMRHVRYRNFFPPERDDIFAGFRSCAPAR